MYNEQLEQLIDAALADGELTEKEKQILFKKAQSFGIDLDEFEMVLDARLVKLKKNEKSESSAPTSNKMGDVKKCPACGAVVGAFKTVCPECDYEFRNVDTNRSITELTNRINAVHEECEQKRKNGAYKSSGFLKSLDSNENVNERLQDDLTQKLNNVIANFPVPNSREDIIELLQFIQPKVQIGSSFDKNASAWRQKYIEIINRAKISYANDAKMMSQIAYYEQASSQSKISSILAKFNALPTNIKPFVALVAIAVFCLIISLIFTAIDDDGKDVQKQKIENVSNESTNSTDVDTTSIIADIQDDAEEIASDVKENMKDIANDIKNKF